MKWYYFLGPFLSKISPFGFVRICHILDWMKSLKWKKKNI